MNYTTLLKHIQEAALSCPNVNSFYSGEVYEDWAKTTKYSSVVCSLENITRNETTITYNVIIYYGDRLLQNDTNTIALYDDGVAIIQHILDIIPEEVTYTAPIIFTPFAQQFMDYIGGVYARISFTVPYSLCNFDN